MPVVAATIVVNSNADTTGTAGTCTLRDAITAAKTNAAVAGCIAGSGTNTITFAASLSGQTITLTSLLPQLTSNLTVDGTSLASHVQISGNNIYQVFYLSSGTTVILTHLDITKGKASTGGGINNYGTLTVNNSTLSSNSATSEGGGIENHGPLTINNSTFSGNSGSGYGGGIENYSTLTVNNSTFSGNSASTGGGIDNWSGTLTLKNSILANSTVGADCTGTVATGSVNNLIKTIGTCTLTNGTNGNLIGVDPLLGTLANNGGSTQTFALLAGSPAIDKGNSATCLPADQRGYARVGICDIGAFEFQTVQPTYAFSTVRNPASTGTGSIATTTTTANGNYTVGTAITLATTGLSAGETVTWSPTTCTASFTMPANALTCTALFTAPTPVAFSTVRSPASTGTGSIAATTTPNGNYMPGTTITLATTGLSIGEMVTWSPAICTASFAMPTNALTCTALFSASTSIVVNSNADTTGTVGICTLRDAITAANTNAVKGGCAAGGSADFITFAPSLSGQTITLTSALPQLTSNITIDGTSLASHVRISGNNAYQVFYIESGTTVILTHLDIINGGSGTYPNYNYSGGGIENYGTLTVNDSIFSGNSGGGAGGIDNLGILTVNNSTFSGNSGGWAGGIDNRDTLIVNNSTFSGNSDGWAGGINSDGTLTVNNSTFSGSVNVRGGGIEVGYGTAIVNNSTFSGNSAVWGGGIEISGGTLTVNNSVIWGNSSGWSSGIDNIGNTVIVKNSILENYYDVSGTGTFTGNNNLTTNPMLGPLANNGGNTQTFALLAGSPAIDAGDPATCLPTDQRGYARVGTCDMGAFEYGAILTYAFSTVRDSASTGTGSIASTTTANGNYAAGTAITLATTGLSAGETVTWSPATCVAPTFNMPATLLTCTATFTTAPTYAFSTVKNSASTGTGSIATTTTASGNYAAGTTLTLATTGLGVGETVTWSSATCVTSFPMPASALTCTALFTAAPPPTTYAFNTVKDPASTGTGSIATTTTASGNYAAGTTLTLATTGLGAGETVTWLPATCVAPTFSMPANAITCKALFTAAASPPSTPVTPTTLVTPTTPGTPPLPDQLGLFLQVEGTGQGKVTTDTGLSCQTSDCQKEKNGDLQCNPLACKQAVKTGITVTLTPQADAGSVFSNWGGSEDCVDGQMLMNSGHLCIAYFQRVVPLTVFPIGPGRVTGYGSSHSQPLIDCGSKCQTSLSDDMTLSLQAIPNPGMFFNGWSGECGTSTQNPLTLTVTKAMVCLATFTTTPVVTPTITPEATTPVVTSPMTTKPPETTPSTETPRPVVTTADHVPTATVTSPATTTSPVVLTTPIVEKAQPPVVTTSVVEKTPSTTTPVVETTQPAIAITPVVETTIPVNVTTTPPPVTVTPITPVEVIPPSVDTLLPVLLANANLFCPTTGDIGEVCNYSGQEVTNLNVQDTGIVSNGVLATTLVNAGWVSNFHITATGKLSGGVVTGYIMNEGIMRDFDFKGMFIIGGTLGGVITNTSHVDGYFQNVTLQANTKITGGSLKGTIKGNKNAPALLEEVRVKSGSKLSGVKLGKDVKLEEGVVVEDKQSPVTTTAKKPVTTTAKKPATTTAKKPATTTAKKPATTTAKKPATTTAKKPVTTTAKKPVTTTKKPTTTTAKKPVTTTPKKPATATTTPMTPSR